MLVHYELFTWSLKVHHNFSNYFRFSAQKVTHNLLKILFENIKNIV